jgi:hypothetical protein
VLGLLSYSILRLRLKDEDEQRVYIQKEQREAYGHLIEEYVKRKQIKKAVLIQYSCMTANSLLEELLKSSESVVLYVQSEDIPGGIGSEEQALRIAWSLADMPGVLKAHYNPKKLAIYKYRVPGSVTAVKIDDDVILMGWYFYLHVNEDDELPHKDRNGNDYSDSFHINGRTTPAVILRKNEPGFEALAKAFGDLEHNYRVSSTLIFGSPPTVRPK